jgi:NAD(P)-dependent dehydrogenase (short-subunit alcohol dehydrogenase family)
VKTRDSIGLAVSEGPQHAEVLINANPNHQALSAFQPIERMGEASDIANAMLFLDSAPFITGEILHVDW